MLRLPWAAGDPLAYVDLARLGRNSPGAVLRALLRILVWWLTPFVAIAVVLGVLAAALGDPRFLDREYLLGTKAGPWPGIALMAATTFPLLLGLRSAVVRSQKRPFMTLISADGRFDLRRALLGGAAWLSAMAIAVAAATALQLLIDPASVALPTRLPHGRDVWLSLLLFLLIVPFQAASEEILFRGWLTQTLGQAIRRPAILVVVVGFLFAVLHGFGAGPLALPYYMLVSFLLSALSLSDGRLESAIGAHTAQNLFVLLIQLPLADPDRAPNLLAGTEGSLGWAALATALLQVLLAYVVARQMLRRLAPDQASRRPPASASVAR